LDFTVSATVIAANCATIGDHWRPSRRGRRNIARGEFPATAGPMRGPDAVRIAENRSCQAQTAGKFTVNLRVNYRRIAGKPAHNRAENYPPARRRFG